MDRPDGQRMIFCERNQAGCLIREACKLDKISLTGNEIPVKEVFVMKLKTDVVIMGSGLSGICAADALLAKGKEDVQEIETELKQNRCTKKQNGSMAVTAL